MVEALNRHFDHGAASSGPDVHILANGLTVVLDQTPFSRNILGIVVTMVGSNNDPPDMLGIAHLLEHLLFKGTKNIGTSDYAGEKVFFDKIRSLDQTLKSSREKNAEFREKLNQLYQNASDYIIENEYVTLLDSIGTSYTRAYTGREATVFQNIFPAAQIEKWLILESERFINPVFRNFNNEIETVVNEIAFYMDKPVSHVIDTFFRRFFSSHPCSNPILGSAETVRNISIEAAERHFDKYYTANNMALIISGDIDACSMLPLIAGTFGNLKSGALQGTPAQGGRPPKGGRPGKKIVKTRLLPFRIGIMGYRTICKGHRDVIPLKVIKKMFHGIYTTGILDQMIYRNKIILGGIETVNYHDTGAFAFYYAPRMFKSFTSIEKQICDELDKLKTLRLDQKLLTSAKAALIKERRLAMEHIEKRGRLLIDHYLSGIDWTDFHQYETWIDSIEGTDVASTANRYFSDADMTFHSGAAFNRPDKKVESVTSFPSYGKPDKISRFARRFNKIKTEKPIEKFITFGDDCNDNKLDVICTDMYPLVHLFYSRNPVNDIFSLRFRYRIGFAKQPLLHNLAQYNNIRYLSSEAGYDSLLALHAIGSAFSVYCDRDSFEVRVNGFEPWFKKTISLVRRLFIPESHHAFVFKSIYQKRKLDLKFAKHDSALLLSALISYVLHGKKTLFPSGISRKSMTASNASSLKNELVHLLQNETDVFYTGSQNIRHILKHLKTEFPLEQAKIKSDPPSQPAIPKLKNDMVYLTHAPGVVNARILIAIEGRATGPQDHWLSALFNAYFGNGTKSIVFQTMRVKKPLAYSAGAFYSPSPTINANGNFLAYAEVKNCNTLECITALKKLIDDMPVRQDLVTQAIKATQNTLASRNTLSFRQLPVLVSDWKRKGFDVDPGINAKKMLETASFTAINEFYKATIFQKPKHILVVGNKKKIDLRGLQCVAQFQEINRKKLFCE